MPELKALVLRLARGLADEPDGVLVEASEREGLVRLRVAAADADKGKIIGKQGRVIKAIRCLAGLAAAKAGKRAMVEVD
ncbi:MAG: KH domain-containing protein [Elusimicrobia bacterium]|nr:KH domain-containing protein [Elusimicrobiota bacterium]MDE2426373.1 KH domain-containing protein [Elusimicrobiota bacterium]